MRELEDFEVESVDAPGGGGILPFALALISAYLAAGGAMGAAAAERDNRLEAAGEL